MLRHALRNAGLSLRTQELTALFLGIRLYCRCVSAALQLRRCSVQLHHTSHKFPSVGVRAAIVSTDRMLLPALLPTVRQRADLLVAPRCSFMMEYDVHTVLDLLTLVATAWVIYTLRVTLKDSYQNEQDTIQTYYVVRVPARTTSVRFAMSVQAGVAAKPSSPEA